MTRTRLTEKMAGDMSLEISEANAQRICRNENKQMPNPGDPILLKTGAKLYNEKGKFFIKGYHYNDDDVKPYQQYAKKAIITAQLDEIAGELEAIDPRLALALDQVSDRLEGRKAFFGKQKPLEETDFDKCKKDALRNKQIGSFMLDLGKNRLIKHQMDQIGLNESALKFTTKDSSPEGQKRWIQNIIWTPDGLMNKNDNKAYK